MLARAGSISAGAFRFDQEWPLDRVLKSALWRQFGAAVDMLENAITACPDDVWGDRSRRPEFWYVAFHALFFLDFYLADAAEGFTPPSPFTLDEMDPAGVLPLEPYTKAELLAYLRHGREKARTIIDGLTDETAAQPMRFHLGEINRFELLLHNLRHVQHHAAQLNLILRQAVDDAPRWVRYAR